MSIKDILVHVDSSPGCASRIDIAAVLARRFSATVKGLFPIAVPSFAPFAPLPPSAALSRTIAQCVDEAREAAALAREKFVEALRHRGARGEWETAEGLPAACIIREAFAADIVVLGQHDPEHPAALSSPADVILACGRPVLVVPRAGNFDRIGDNILLAWNGSREANRTTHDAIPFLREAKSVTVLTILSDGNEGIAACADIVPHLAHHGVAATAEELPAEEAGTSETLLSRAADMGADLIVMGAYGHSRARELVLGGATREVLQHMTIPVLMAH